MIRKTIFSIFIIFTGCGGNSISDIIDAVKEPDRKPIDASVLGTNAFFNNAQFGSIGAQAKEVKETLRLNYIRVLFAWNEAVQPSPGVEPDFTFYDEIVAKASARNLEMLVVLTDVPNWMADPSNWTTDGNPRKTFAESWVRKVVDRYKSNPHVAAFQIWNEPNEVANQDTQTLMLSTEPLNYLELLCYSFSVVHDIADKIVVSAASTAINQNYPDSINYNKTLRDNGAESCLDVFGVHVYGKQFENFIRSGGVIDFLKSLSRIVWVTESGAQGTNSQLPYAEQMWPYLRSEIPQIARIYQYQFVENTPAATTYGLRNLTPGSELSDLYIFLRDR